MERDFHSSLPIGRDVDEIFVERSRRHVRQGIEMASFVLSQPLLELRDANQRQVALFESYVEATMSVDRRNYEAQLFGTLVQYGEIEFSDEPTDIEKAEQALMEARISVQASYDLKQRHVKRAERISLKKFDNNRTQPETSV